MTTDRSPQADGGAHVTGGARASRGAQADRGVQARRDAREHRVLGGERVLRSRDVSREAGVSLMSARRFWRALGFPAVEESMEAFTAADVDALQRVSSLVREGLVDESVALALTRAVGRSVDRLASWQVQLLGEVLAERRQARHDDHPVRARGHAEGDPGLGADVAELVAELADELEPLVVYAWRRHLASAVQRFVAEEPADPSVPTMRRVVGFADLVSFTKLVRRLSERELAVLVQRFEAVTSDVVSTFGGRVIKTVGDQALFVAWPPSAAAEIGLGIAEELTDDPLMPDARVGLAAGDVVARLGDVFGTTVNRASRLTSMARPGTVLVDGATAAALEASRGFRCTPLPSRSAKGLGPLVRWRLSRAADPQASPPG